MSNQQEPVKRPKTKRFMAHIYFDRETGEQLDEPDDQICVFADLHDRDIKALRDKNDLLQKALLETEDNLTAILTTISEAWATEKSQPLTVSICNAKEVPDVE